MAAKFNPHDRQEWSTEHDARVLGGGEFRHASNLVGQVCVLVALGFFEQSDGRSVNAAILEAILNGRETGPKRDMVLLNASAALACAGLADHMDDGLEIAREMITSGAALDRLRRLQKASQA